MIGKITRRLIVCHQHMTTTVEPSVLQFAGCGRRESRNWSISFVWSVRQRARRAGEAGLARSGVRLSGLFGLSCWQDRKTDQRNQRDQIDRPTRQTSPFRVTWRPNLTGCGKTRVIRKKQLKDSVWCWDMNSLRMLKRAVQQGRSERRGEAYASVR